MYAVTHRLHLHVLYTNIHSSTHSDMRVASNWFCCHGRRFNRGSCDTFRLVHFEVGGNMAGSQDVSGRPHVDIWLDATWKVDFITPRISLRSCFGIFGWFRIFFPGGYNWVEDQCIINRTLFIVIRACYRTNSKTWTCKIINLENEPFQYIHTFLMIIVLVLAWI